MIVKIYLYYLTCDIPNGLYSLIMVVIVQLYQIPYHQNTSKYDLVISVSISINYWY